MFSITQLTGSVRRYASRKAIVWTAAAAMIAAVPAITLATNRSAVKPSSRHHTTSSSALPAELPLTGPSARASTASVREFRATPVHSSRSVKLQSSAHRAHALHATHKLHAAHAGHASHKLHATHHSAIKTSVKPAVRSATKLTAHSARTTAHPLTRYNGM